MRVLHLVKTSIGATWALRQMRELVKLGVDVHVAIPNGSLVSKYEDVGVIVHNLQTDFPIRKLWEIPNVFRKFRRLVSEVEPDIIHSHFVGTTLTMRLALGKNHHIPRIFQVPGPLHLENAFFSRVDYLTSGKADYWVGSCQWTCEFYRKLGIVENKIFLSYYGTDLQDFTTTNLGKLRTEFGIESDTIIVGMVAYMYAPKRYLGQKTGLKGHEDLIDAIAICLDRGYNVTGVFIGGAWNGAVKYEQLVRTYGQAKCGNRVFFLGTRTDVTDLYSDIDITVHPSHSENVGGAVESCLMGKPTIATNVGGFPDLIISDKTGWLVKPKQPVQLADAITSAIDNPQVATELAYNGQQLAKQLFDVRITAKKIHKIYGEITSQLDKYS